jgi:hypothetical protein
LLFHKLMRFQIKQQVQHDEIDQSCLAMWWRKVAITMYQFSTPYLREVFFFFVTLLTNI